MGSCGIERSEQTNPAFQFQQQIENELFVSFSIPKNLRKDQNPAEWLRDNSESDILADPLELVVYKQNPMLTCVPSDYTIKGLLLKNPKTPQVTCNINKAANLTRSLSSSSNHTIGLKSVMINEFGGNYKARLEELTEDVLKSFSSEEDNSFAKAWMIAVAIVAMALSATIGVLLIFCKMKEPPRRFNKHQIHRFLKGLESKKEVMNKESVPYASVSYDVSREINLNSLTIERELKGGNFGKVYFGQLQDSRMSVAIKTVKDDPLARKEDVEYIFSSFLNEIKFMQCIGCHPNVVGYIGAVTFDIANYNAHLVMEYCSAGDLKSYLEKFKMNGGSFLDDSQGRHLNFQSRNTYHPVNSNQEGYLPTLKTSHLLKWAEDIATGLEYIASKNLVHNDIAARNILLSSQGSSSSTNGNPKTFTAKISDFGLSRNLDDVQQDYYQIVFDSDHENNGRRKVPLRWLSIEALNTLRFTTESDVWAMGVTFWEMFTFADVPYSGLVDIRADLRTTLIEHLQDGNMLPEPAFAPAEIWDIMTHCWNEEPKERPSFRELRQSLRAINEKLYNQIEAQTKEMSSPTYSPLNNHWGSGKSRV